MVSRSDTGTPDFEVSEIKPASQIISNPYVFIIPKNHFGELLVAWIQLQHTNLSLL